MPSSYLVYKISNTVNDRLYVGLTTNGLEKRWREHRCASKTKVDKPLYRAMRLHGVENFKIELVYEATSAEDMREAELRYIAELKAHVKDGGYNLTDHGYQHGNEGVSRGEDNYRAKLTEEMVAFIRSPEHWDKSNTAILDMLEEMFGFDGARDTVRDARRGDVWRHLNDKYPPVRSGQGKRAVVTDKRRAISKQTLDMHREEALRKLAESKRGKRGPNAKLSEDTVRSVFYSPLSLLKTAAQYGVSKKMVLLIKQRKAHVYLTKEL